MNRQLSIVESGFTLVEMLIGIFVFVIIAVGLTVLVSSILTSSNKQSNLLADSDQARKLAVGLINRVRDAQTGATGGYALETVGDQTLSFYSNMDSDALVEKIRYFAQNDKLYQGIIKPSGNPLAYDSGTEIISSVQNNLANGLAPIFYYYDDTYDGIASTTPLSQPVNVTQVRFIKLDLKIYNKAGNQGTNTYTVTAGGSLRNLKDNLGEGENLLVQVQLTTQVLPGGAGSIAVSPTGPDYYGNTLVNLNAYSNLGYGFSNWTGDVYLSSSSATTILMEEDETVTANFSVIPQTLTGSIGTKIGPTSARRWNLRITNTNNFAVNSVNLLSFSLTHTAGTFCTPVITIPAAFPVLVGNIGALGNRTYQATINFTGCSGTSRFTADFTFSGNSGAQWGSASILNQPQ